MIGSHETLPKPCRQLRAMGKCPQSDAKCEYPLGRRTKCFAVFEKAEGSVVSLLDMALELHDEVSDDGKQKVPVFAKRVW